MGILILRLVGHGRTVHDVAKNDDITCAHLHLFWSDRRASQQLMLPWFYGAVRVAASSLPLMVSFELATPCFPRRTLLSTPLSMSGTLLA